MQNEFIKITKSDFADNLLKREDVDASLRSIEKFLERNKHKYNWDAVGDGFVIKVSDENEAIKIAGEFNSSFGVEKVTYYQNSKSKTIKPSSYKKQKTARPRYSFFDKNTGKTLNKKQFGEKIKRDCLSKTQIVKKGILPKAKLEQAVRNKEIETISTGKVVYISRGALQRYFKNKNN